MPLAFSSAAFSQVVDLEITNLTHGLHFTPFFINAHDSNEHLFQVATDASAAIQAMAEGGDISMLSSAAPQGSVSSENPAMGLLAPSSSTEVLDLDTGNNTHLSVVSMLLPTNDGFVGLDGWEIPEEAGTYTVYLNAYDAGTEANDEIINGMGASGEAGIPAAPGGDAGTGATGVTDTEANTTVHIHRGNVGDTDGSAGISDVDSRIHRWLNPVAKIVVTVK
mgnify:CR=1 FL=1